MRHLTVLAVLAVCAGFVASAGAQSGGPGHLTFDVASVKRNGSGDPSIGFQVGPGGRFVAANIPLKQFIRAAYTLQLYQIVDAPPWVDAERFDITAVSDRDLTDSRPWIPGAPYLAVQAMMQSLLADRFKLVAGLEERDAPGYALVPAKGGDASRLRPAKMPCEGTCGMRPAPGRLTARGVPLPTLAEFLSQVIGRLVVDDSGLKGEFDLDLRWSPDGQPDADAPSIFAALPEQAGLRLEPRRARHTVLVVKSIDRPSPD
jgi:uncharacterized protein (TIGR03435 family)